MMVMLIPAQLVIANVSSKRQMKQRVQGCASRIDSRHTCRRRHHHLFSAMLQDVFQKSSFTRTRLSCQENGLVRMNNKGCRSEEHTSELQSRENLVCRLLLE